MAELINARELRFAPDILNVISPLFYYMGYIAARISVRSYDQAVYFLRQFVWPILIATPLALGQSLGNPGITQLVLAVAPGAGATRRLENDGLTRATGLVGHWTGFGAYAVCVVAAAVALLIISKHLGLRRPRLALVTLLAAAMCVISTLTLSVAVAALAIVLCCWRSAGLGRQLLIAAGVLSATASVVFGSLIQARVDQQFTDRVSRISWLPDWVPDTLNYRARIWTEQTIPMVQDRPLTGWGTNLYEGVYLGLEGQRVYPTQLLWHSPESQWLGSAMTFGLFGLCAQVVLLLAIAHLLISAHRERDSMLIARPILMLFVMSILVATTVPVFTNRGFPMAFWPLLGVLTGIYLSGSRSARNSAD
ncbi:O-antigen ligase family protein [Marisediminicola senii]|uniref:O-antigen ligase family protein n=1 Tax=Marisediminicola senii TaxID=2711233 RepID=UPI0013ECA079|nr:O-antigen ligase family protein [Marisediminicola senii]